MPIGARKNIGLFLGIITSLIGFLGVLTGINILKFQMPLSINVLAWILAVGGLYLIVTSVTEIGAKKAIGVLVAFVALIMASMPIFNQLGIASFSLGINLLVYYILLTIEGIFLVMSAFGT